MNSLIALLQKLYRLFVLGCNKLQSPLLLAIRLFWGWQFFITGKGKLKDLGQVTEFFRGLHIPFPGLNAALAGTTECIGGLLLLIGLASRPVSLALAFTMTIALITADWEVVKNIFSDPDKFLAADPFPFFFAAIIVLAFGPGYFSVDTLIGKRMAGTSSSPKVLQDP